MTGGGLVAGLQEIEDRGGGKTGVAAYADADRPDETEHARVGIDLDDPCVLGPVFDAVLGQRAEWPQPGAKRQDHIGLGDHLHRRLRSLIAQRTAQKLVAGGEGVVVQIAGDHRGGEVLRQRHRLGLAAGHDDAAAGDDDRELGL